LNSEDGDEAASQCQVEIVSGTDRASDAGSFVDLLGTAVRLFAAPLRRKKYSRKRRGNTAAANSQNFLNLFCA